MVDIFFACAAIVLVVVFWRIFVGFAVGCIVLAVILVGAFRAVDVWDKYEKNQPHVGTVFYKDGYKVARDYDNYMDCQWDLKGEVINPKADHYTCNRK